MFRIALRGRCCLGLHLDPALPAAAREERKPLAEADPAPERPRVLRQSRLVLIPHVPQCGRIVLLELRRWAGEAAARAPTPSVRRAARGRVARRIRPCRRAIESAAAAAPRPARRRTYFCQPSWTSARSGSVRRPVHELVVEKREPRLAGESHRVAIGVAQEDRKRVVLERLGDLPAEAERRHCGRARPIVLPARGNRQTARAHARRARAGRARPRVLKRRLLSDTRRRRARSRRVNEQRLAQRAHDRASRRRGRVGGAGSSTGSRRGARRRPVRRAARSSVLACQAHDAPLQVDRG